MCEPISAATMGAIAMGGASAGFSIMSAVGQHQQQAAMTARSNAIAQQQYQQQLQITAAQEQEKARAYQAKLAATAAAKNAYHRQLEANQAEASRASVAEQQKLIEQGKTAKFNQQGAIASAIKAQGQVLSTGKSGQSFLLQAMEADRALGFEMAQINETLYDASLASGLAQEGILLDQYSADVSAFNNIPANPLAPPAEFSPIKPIKAPGPSKMALVGNIGSALIGGAAVGEQAYDAFT